MNGDGVAARRAAAVPMQMAHVAGRSPGSRCHFGVTEGYTDVSKDVSPMSRGLA